MIHSIGKWIMCRNDSVTSLSQVDWGRDIWDIVFHFGYMTAVGLNWFCFSCILLFAFRIVLSLSSVTQNTLATTFLPVTQQSRTTLLDTTWINRYCIAYTHIHVQRKSIIVIVWQEPLLGWSVVICSQNLTISGTIWVFFRSGWICSTQGCLWERWRSQSLY